MADWPFSPEETQATKVALAGAFGALVQVYLRHPGHWFRALCLIVFGVGQAMIFAQLAADWSGLPVVPVAAVIGLCGHKLAERLLKAAERAEFTPFGKRKEGP